MSASAIQAVAEHAGGWTLLFAGGTDWAQMGRGIGKGKKDPKSEEERERLYPNLVEPTRLKALAGIRVMFVAAGSSAVHCMAGDTSGRLYAWGRNEKGQLGHGDLRNRNSPTIVQGLGAKFISGGAAGKHHSLAFTKEGEAWAWGLNMQGQLGTGSVKKGASKANEDIQTLPVKSLIERCTACSAGADFSMWISTGKLYSAGNPQYGQTGEGTDHAYNTKDSSIAMVNEPQPTPKLIPALASKTVTRVACGTNHSIAVDDAGACYTWGNGGYGRLGHKVQKDEFAPKKVETFMGRLSVPPDAVIAAGTNATFCSATVGGTQQSLYCWGKMKTSGDSQMYPVICQDMQGWNVRSVACGPAHFAIAADKSAITWGHATNGELGYGPKGKKSSANAAKCQALDDMHTHQVAAGVGFTLFLVDSEAPQVERRPEFESEAPEEACEEESDPGPSKAAAGKRKAAPAEPAAKKGKKK
ncbi:RCC1/BLIP-II [Haematococcus lacustris]